MIKTLPPTLFFYLARQYMKWVLALLALLLSFITLVDIIELLRRSSEQAEEYSFGYILLVSALNVPQLLDMILPFAVLFGSITCFYSWSRSHEFITARGLGQSIWQALLPVICSCLLIGFFHILVINPISATTSASYESHLDQIVKYRTKTSLSVSSNGVWLRDRTAEHQMIINGQSLTPEEGEIQHAVIYFLNDKGGIDWRLRAERINLQSGAWIIPDAVRIANQGVETDLGNISVSSVLDKSALLQSTRPPKTINIFSLPKFIDVLGNAGLPVDKYRVHFHQLLSTPLKLLGLAMLAASFTLIHFSRQQRVRLILMGLGCGFAFYFLSDLIYLLGSTSRLPNQLAGWAPALLICAAGGYFLARVDEH